VAAAKLPATRSGKPGGLVQWSFSAASRHFHNPGLLSGHMPSSDQILTSALNCILKMTGTSAGLDIIQAARERLRAMDLTGEDSDALDLAQDRRIRTGGGH